MHTKESMGKDSTFQERAELALERLWQRAGIVDALGRRIRKDLPEDMREGQDRDFGG